MKSKVDDQPRADCNTGAVKLSPNDNETYSSGVVALRPDGSGQDRSITVAVEQYEEFPMGTKLTTAGDTWITPYVREGRVSVSVICEKLVPVKDDQNSAPALPPLVGDKK